MLFDTKLTKCGYLKDKYMSECSTQEFAINCRHKLKPNTHILFAGGLNGTNFTHENSSDQPMYKGLRVALIVLDSFGFVINTLGVDMLWHGVEVNHAVYALLLQDVVLAAFTTFLSLMFNWIYWFREEYWFIFHLVLSLLSLTFQDWCWSYVAHLR